MDEIMSNTLQRRAGLDFLRPPHSYTSFQIWESSWRTAQRHNTRDRPWLRSKHHSGPDFSKSL